MKPCGITLEITHIGAEQKHILSHFQTSVKNKLWLVAFYHLWTLKKQIQNMTHWQIQIQIHNEQRPVAFHHFWTLPRIGGRRAEMKWRLSKDGLEEQSESLREQQMFKDAQMWKGERHIWKENNFQKLVMPKFTRECLRLGQATT